MEFPVELWFLREYKLYNRALQNHRHLDHIKVAKFVFIENDGFVRKWCYTFGIMYELLFDLGIKYLHLCFNIDPLTSLIIKSHKLRYQV